METTNYAPILAPTASISKTAWENESTTNTKPTWGHKLFCQKQGGFRRELGTEGTIVDLLSYTYRGINQRKPSLVTFFDLAKAFDCVNRSLLLLKLRNSGTRSNGPWFRKLPVRKNPSNSNQHKHISKASNQHRSNTGECTRPVSLPYLHQWSLQILWKCSSFTFCRWHSYQLRIW